VSGKRAIVTSGKPVRSAVAPKSHGGPHTARSVASTCAKAGADVIGGGRASDGVQLQCVYEAFLPFMKLSCQTRRPSKSVALSLRGECLQNSGA